MRQVWQYHKNAYSNNRTTRRKMVWAVLVRSSPFGATDFKAKITAVVLRTADITCFSDVTTNYNRCFAIPQRNLHLRCKFWVRRNADAVGAALFSGSKHNQKPSENINDVSFEDIPKTADKECCRVAIWLRQTLYSRHKVFCGNTRNYSELYEKKGPQFWGISPEW
jgi:hypothetical protein